MDQDFNIYLAVARVLKREVNQLAVEHELDREAVIRELLTRRKRDHWAAIAYRTLPARLSEVLPMEHRIYGNQLIKVTLELIRVELLNKARNPKNAANDWFEVAFANDTAWKSLTVLKSDGEAQDAF